ncbi:MAG: ped [Ramlibacter sp.]|jgi:NAD(P)-dependent dehydrogenase (short-subunit alcohol dehydrogenase family)|nr:ped [Ramlibacter sp.]
MNRSTTGKVALVTGGASGIGLVFARRLLQEGCSVVLADLRGAPAAAEKLAREGAAVSGVDADVADEAQVAHMVAAAVQRFGGIDLLINNAGIFTSLSPKPFEQLDVAEWNKVMAVNVLGPFLCARAVVPEMRKRGGGKIVNVASTTALKGTPNLLHYVASKGAVISMTRSMARELGKDKITVNSIAPGFTLSDGVLAGDMRERLGGNSVAARSLQRDQTPEDLTGALAFLTGPGSDFVTGQTLIVDGGSAFN